MKWLPSLAEGRGDALSLLPFREVSERTNRTFVGMNRPTSCIITQKLPLLTALG